MISLRKKFAGVAALAMLGLAGCDEGKSVADRQQQQQQQALDNIRAAGVEIEPINLPPAMDDLDKGSYQVKIQTENGPRDCIANVVITTHYRKNIVLDCN